MEANTPFPCNACGKCCRHVNLSEQTAYLVEGMVFVIILMNLQICALYMKLDH